MKCPIPLSEWPDWANWAAMNVNGLWHFYKRKPELSFFNWMPKWFGKKIQSNYKGSKFPWYQTLTHRSELENQNQ